jgi:hypothetical protein
MSAKNTKPVTTSQYTTIEEAYDWFNDKLFAGRLPMVLITLQRKSTAQGYFSPERFRHRSGESRVDELALNPDHLDRSDKEILSVLVHEMAHVWQQHHGHPSRAGYHNQEWAKKMLQIGLLPISIDQPGKMTGQKLTHEVIPFGPFEVAFDAWMRDRAGCVFEWASAGDPSQSAAPGDPEPKDPKAKNKTAYTCPGCESKAWGKPGLNLICGDCDLPFSEDL